MKNKSPLGYKIVTGILVVIIVLLTAFMAVTLPTDWFGKGNPFGEMTGPEGPSDPDTPTNPTAGYTIETSGIQLGNTQMVTGNTTTIKSGDSQGLSTALQGAKAGDTIILEGGTYSFNATQTLTQDGAYNGYITVKAADGADVVLDFSRQEFLNTNRGIQIYGDYWYWYGIEVVGAGDNGMYIGGNYNIIENCEFHNNRDTGLQIGRAESGLSNISQWPSYNYIKNCTSYNNYDNESKGENADGFAAKLTVGYGNVFDGCIAYRNSDDGWDLYAYNSNGDIGAVIMYNCVAFENGYIAETVEEFNAKVNCHENALEDTNKYKYTTQNGDGNGFKLGGSVMRGNVVMYNCLSFNNRMHGVTDNSNPGVISVDKITSYNNGAGLDLTMVGAIDENGDPIMDPATGEQLLVESSSYGLVIGGSAGDKCNNIDLARSDESYNNLKNVLSVADSYGAPGNDAYRGSVYNSIFYNGTEYRQIKDYTDAYSEDKDKNGTALTEALSSAEVFKALPITSQTTDGVTSYSVNITGLENGNIHETFRNEADNSINMGDLLAVADPAAVSNTGATLNLTSWDAYEHFYETQLSEAQTQADALLTAVYNMLYLYTDTAAVYQDFTLTTAMNGTTISWSSSDENILEIKKHYNSSNSDSQDVDIVVNRPAKDTKVTLTAYINYRGTSAVKRFDLTIKAATYSLGDIYIEGLKDVVTETDRRFLIDQYEVFEEPELVVENGDDYNGKILSDGSYTVDSVYEYATSANSPYVNVGNFSASVAGVYRITHTVTYQGDSDSFTYYIYVASNDAIVDFVGTPTFAVNVDGYTLSGSVTNVKGTINSYSTSDAAEIAEIDSQTTEQAKVDLIGDKVSSTDFTDNAITAQFSNANDGEYTVYYWFTNGEGTVTSKVYSQQVNVVEIGTADEYASALADNNSSTIYMLTADLDFTSGYTPVDKLYGLINGDGHTIKNITIDSGSKSDDRFGMFTNLNGGTIMNVRFENINITSAVQETGIIGRSYGGYIHNVLVNNLNVNTTASRVGGLIGRQYAGDIYITQVALINDEDHKLQTTGEDIAGFIGLMQSSSDNVTMGTINIADCYIDTEITASGRYVGGVVSRFDTRHDGDRLTIERVYSRAVVSGTNYIGGIIGAQSKERTGILQITVHDCVFLGKLIYAGTTLTNVPEKNASGIFGRYSETAIVDISGCISYITEHGYEEFVTAVEDRLSENFRFWNGNYVDNFDFENTWEYLAPGWEYGVDDNDTDAPYPYIGLRFDGLFEYPAAAEETPEGGATAQ